jgi:hypothetical protein
MKQMKQEKMPKNAENFYCEKCDFICCKESNYNKHLNTRKHKNETNETKKMPKDIFNCLCGLSFNSRTTLWRHKKKCNNEINNEKIVTNDNINDTTNLKKLILEVMNQNKELVKTIAEITPKIGNTTITNSNNNNKTFNLHFFLNETCKNAMNLNQFVDNIDITMDDLKYTRINGLVEGISNIIIRGLKQLEIHERPIHCTDFKRDTLYIKDNEKWTKDENNEKFKETIEEIIEKEQYALNMWTDAHPDWDKITHLQDEYVLMVNRLYQPVMEDDKKGKKIIKNISKEIIVNKNPE